MFILFYDVLNIPYLRNNFHLPFFIFLNNIHNNIDDHNIGFECSQFHLK